MPPASSTPARFVPSIAIMHSAWDGENEPVFVVQSRASRPEPNGRRVRSDQQEGAPRLCQRRRNLKAGSRKSESTAPKHAIMYRCCSAECFPIETFKKGFRR